MYHRIERSVLFTITSGRFLTVSMMSFLCLFCVSCVSLSLCFLDSQKLFFTKISSLQWNDTVLVICSFFIIHD